MTFSERNRNKVTKEMRRATHFKAEAKQSVENKERFGRKKKAPRGRVSTGQACLEAEHLGVRGCNKAPGIMQGLP